MPLVVGKQFKTFNFKKGSFLYSKEGSVEVRIPNRRGTSNKNNGPEFILESFQKLSKTRLSNESIPLRDSLLYIVSSFYLFYKFYCKNAKIV